MSEQTPKANLDTNQITDLRGKIDSIDEQIQRLINERAGIAQQVAIAKKSHEDHPIFYRPEREAQVLKAVMARNTGPLSGEKMARLFREIMSVCLELEAPQKVAFLGPVGTFTHAAALKHFVWRGACGKLIRGRGQSYVGRIFGVKPKNHRRGGVVHSS